MLTVENLAVAIDRTPVLRGVHLTVPEGALMGLIGRNGAGKTTLLRSVMGLVRPTGGTVRLAGRDCTFDKPHRRVAAHIGYMPEDRRLVPGLSAADNVCIPAWSVGLDDVQARLQWIYRLMPEVEGFAPRRALQLSGGQQKLVALARALMVGRRLLLLDEPFEGIAPALSQRLLEVLQALKGEGLSILLAESDDVHSAGLVDGAYTIERGVVTAR
ncbi:MAG: ABC transporter ATP-binding protein [Candidatus Competibacterales bacterium]